MAKPSSNEKTIVIILTILRYIPKVGRITGQDILKKLEDEGISLNIRTIQRYLVLLCEHYDIEKDDRSKPFGYRWQSNGQRFDVPHLTEQQSLLLALTKKHLEHLLPTNVMTSMSSLFDRANYQLHHDENSKLGQEWLNKVCVAPTSQPLLPAAIDSDILATVSTALYQNKMLDIEYKNQFGKSHKAQIQPLGLAQQGTNLYLIVKYPKYEDVRNLALHRITNAKMTIHKFKQPPEFDLETYKTKGRFGFGTGQKIQLSFVINKQEGFHLTETRLSEDQIITEYSSSQFYVQATVFDSEMLDWWLGTFEHHVQMINKKKIS